MSPTEQQDPTGDEARALALLVIRVGEQARAEFVQASDEVDLPVPLRRVLLLLDRPRPMREIAAQLACDPSYITGLADQLEGRGLARRTAGSDRRVKLLAATDAGTAIRDELAAAVARRAFGRQLSPDERGVLRDLLTRLRDG